MIKNKFVKPLHFHFFCSCRILLPCVLTARPVALETFNRRQCALLRNCCRMGRMPFCLGYASLHSNVAHAQESHVGGVGAYSRASIFGHGHYIWRPRVPLRVRQDNRPRHPAGCLSAAIHESGDATGGAAKGRTEQPCQVGLANSHLMTVS